MKIWIPACPTVHLPWHIAAALYTRDGMQQTRTAKHKCAAPARTVKISVRPHLPASVEIFFKFYWHSLLPSMWVERNFRLERVNSSFSASCQRNTTRNDYWMPRYNVFHTVLHATIRLRVSQRFCSHPWGPSSLCYYENISEIWKLISSYPKGKINNFFIYKI